MHDADQDPLYRPAGRRDARIGVRRCSVLEQVTPTEANLPELKRLLHGESSKALNALMARERYDQARQV